MERQPSLLDERHSVYSHDEFDVFSGAVPDQSRVHIGKKFVRLPWCLSELGDGH